MKGSTRKQVKRATKKAAPKTRKRVIEVELIDLHVEDGGEPDELHLLAMEEFCRGDSITLEELNAMLALHSRKAVASLPAPDDETYDDDLKDLVNA